MINRTRSRRVVLQEDVIERLCSTLSDLPPVIRYRDDFDDTIRTIRAPARLSEFELSINGCRVNVDFSVFDERRASILKHVFIFILGENLSISTAASYIHAARQLTEADLVALLQARPTGVRAVWVALRARGLPAKAYIFAKCLLHLLCVHRLFGWTAEHRTYIRTALPMPVYDSYAGIHSGDVFLSIDEEAAILRHLDKIASLSTTAKCPSFDEICSAGMLLCAYQFGMRPIQIAMLAVNNVRIWSDVPGSQPTVHLTFYMAKQRGDSKRIPLTRRVKREWSSIFVAMQAHHQLGQDVSARRYFAVQSASEAGVRIASLVKGLVGSNYRGSANDLRHTAAQRLVDAGASHEELAAFLGHADARTGLVYFATSASHAERVNRALGASEIYQRVAKLAHDRFISPSELTELKGDQQIGGVPHGISIAGIGGCSAGQHACPYNPIMSCYSCDKFMPLHEKKIHQQVLSSMREVVLFFESHSRGETQSPTYLQLQRTIAEVQQVLAELEDKMP